MTDCSAKEEELAGRCLFQEVSLDRCLQQLEHWIQHPHLHLHLNALCCYKKLTIGPQAFQEMFVYVSAEESHQSMDYGRMVNFSS